MGRVVKRQREEKQEIQLLQQNLQMTHLVIRMLAFLPIAFLHIVSADCDPNEYMLDQIDCEGVCSYIDSTQIACFSGLTNEDYGSCKDERKRNAMHLAALEDDPDCTLLTMTRGVSMYAKDEDDKTAADLALSEGNCNAYRVQASFNGDVQASFFTGSGMAFENITDQQAKCVAPCCGRIQISSTSTSGASAHQPESFRTYRFDKFDFSGFAFYQAELGHNNSISYDPTSGLWMVRDTTILGAYSSDNKEFGSERLRATETCNGPCPNAKACNKGWSYYHNDRWNSDENIILKCV